MLDCCEGCRVELLLKVDSKNLETSYQTTLDMEQARELIDALELGDCPACSGLVPFEQHAS